MKIAIRSGLALVLSAILAGRAPATAQDIAMAGEGPKVPAYTPSVTAPPVVETKPAELPKIDPPVLESAKDKTSAKAMGAKDKESDGDLTSGEVPPSVKGIVKRLNLATEGVSLDDLNSAREAVAKLDILIDIEKRLTDLASLRQEREEKTLTAAIPASALPPVGQIRPPPQIPAYPVADRSLDSVAVIPVSPPLSSVEVTRIVGAGGVYTATIKEGEKVVTVRQGDKLSDGSVVQSISNRSVTLERNKKTQTVNVKDVAVVFSGR